VSIGLVFLAAAAPSSAGTEAPTPVIKTKKRVEVLPGAAAGWLAWSESRIKRQPQFNLMARPDGGAPFRVNPPDTQGFDAHIEGSTLVYSQVAKPKPDIAFYDLSSRMHTGAPAGVNTTQAELIPSTSGDWLMFLRSRRLFRGTASIILRNVVTGEERILESGNYERGGVEPGNLAGDFASWLECTNRSLSRCNVTRYQISTGATTQIPNPKGRAQFAASVTSDGTVYFAESGNLICGKHAGLWRYTATGVREQLARFPKGFDTGRTSPLPSGGTTTVYLDGFDCGTEAPTGDIYQVIA
jgi:hypothetical protein